MLIGDCFSKESFKETNEQIKISVHFSRDFCKNSYWLGRKLAWVNTVRSRSNAKRR